LGQTLAPSDFPASETEWRNVLRRSSTHLVTPALRWAMREQGYTSQLPPDVLEFIDAVYTLNLEANRRYEEQLAHLIHSLNSIGVHPVLLKGAAALVGELYPTAGERMIGDIDISFPFRHFRKFWISWRPWVTEASMTTKESYLTRRV
jgi:hypothetical protein